MEAPLNTTSPTPGERRRTRIAHQALAELYASDWSVTEGLLQDISQTGLYLQLAGALTDRPALGAGVTIKLIMQKNQSYLVVEAWAKVVRVDQGGVAIRFGEPLPWWPAFVLFPAPKAGSRGRVGTSFGGATGQDITDSITTSG